MEEAKINWENFASAYWKPTEGKQHKLKAKHWREETSTFGGKEETPKPVIVLDITQVDNISFDEPLEFSSGAVGFAKEFKPIVERAEDQGRDTLHFLLKFHNKKYTLVDLHGEE